MLCPPTACTPLLMFTAFAMVANLYRQLRGRAYALNFRLGLRLHLTLFQATDYTALVVSSCTKVQRKKSELEKASVICCHRDFFRSECVQEQVSPSFEHALVHAIIPFWSAQETRLG